MPRVRFAPLMALFPDRFTPPSAAATSSPLAAAAPGGARAEASPASYDLGALGRLSPIRDQGRYGTCWAFAALASLESGLLPGAANDFSENNMAQRSGFALGYGGGGNSYMAAAYLLRWAGPVTEAADPYAPYASSPNPSPENAAVGTHVHEFLELPSRSGPTDNDDLKWAVMTYGAVYTSMYWKASAFREASDAYYFSGASGPNHAVTLVGWDDAYPASRFASPPAGPGAFLVRNSWGTSFGLQRLLLGLLRRHRLRDRQRGLRRRRGGDGRRADLPARPARLGRLVSPVRRRRSGHGVVRRGVHGGGGRHAQRRRLLRHGARRRLRGAHRILRRGHRRRPGGGDRHPRGPRLPHGDARCAR